MEKGKSANIKTNDKIKGIICILLAAFGFSLMTFFVRISGDLPTMQKAFFRNAVAAVVVLVPILKSKEKFHVHENVLLIYSSVVCSGPAALYAIFMP